MDDTSSPTTTDVLPAGLNTSRDLNTTLSQWYGDFKSLFERIKQIYELVPSTLGAASFSL